MRVSVVQSGSGAHFGPFSRLIAGSSSVTNCRITSGAGSVDPDTGEIITP